MVHGPKPEFAVAQQALVAVAHERCPDKHIEEPNSIFHKKIVDKRAQRNPGQNNMAAVLQQVWRPLEEAVGQIALHKQSSVANQEEQVEVLSMRMRIVSHYVENHDKFCQQLGLPREHELPSKGQPGKGVDFTKMLLAVQ